jgi:hypothetical protein
MRPLALQAALLAHLRGSGRPQTSRDLAARFLRIGGGDEETCRRLLAPILAEIRGVTHRPGEGWSWSPMAGPSAAEARAASAPQVTGPPGHPPGRDPGAGLRDFIALAADGAGPGGSGVLRAVSLLPVLAGEPCQEEHLPGEEAGPEDSPDTDLEDLTGGDAPRRPGPDRAGLLADDLESLIETIGDLPVVCHRVGREVEPIRRACAAGGLSFHPVVISAAKLGHLLLGLKANHAALDLAAALGVTAHGPDDCRGRARTVAACYLALLPRLEERGIGTIEALAEYQDMPPAPLDLSGYTFSAEDLKALPAGPGVYRFLDRDGQVIYVGKAKNLRVRVATYFAPSARATAKGRAILEQTRRLSVEACASELEAILLEAALIAEHRPRLNRQFDVHERAAPYGPRLNLVVVLPDRPAGEAAASTCTLHFLRRGRYLGREARVTEDAASWERIGARVDDAYFPREAGASAPEPAAHADEAADVDWQVVGSFLRRHRDAVNVLDVDECESAGEAIARLRVLAAAACAGSGGRVFAR